MLKLENIVSYYGESLAINQINLEVKEGIFHGILGKNGMGKTTLLKTIMGLMDKMDGSINLVGKDITKLKTNDRAIEGLGYVPQGRGIMPQFTIEENLLIGTFARDKENANNINEDFEFVLKLFPILKQFWKRRGGDLSGGQQQQLAIGRALLTKPKILILDEPTEGIQPNVVEEIENVLIRLNKEFNLTIIIVEQNVNFIKKAADKFSILERGKIVEEGNSTEITNDLVQKYLTV
ncbi:MAG: urea ABC transporter ATP-binding subunit UrtE [Pelagibacteraceae bacterium]|jgi:urea transport system ATP-binding protein|nr:urea ABC transporter ATP-binding subunit UrtE [Pelagibacteraceae bacterium]MBT6688480.1 urea ABC transporter ATP-binding subunit UrtE [Flavobacteriaceae bacterium]|tara:strand:+ start:184 stop:891 length:708 start_codon:yes stop_codon:yes gene_type:complete